MFRKLAAALVAPLLLASACADEADPGEAASLLETGGAVAAVRATPERASEAGSARFEMTFSFDTPEGPVEMTSTGAYDGERLAMEIGLASLLDGLPGATAEALPEGFDEPMQLVVDGTTAYMRVPLLEPVTGTSGWLSAPLDELGPAGEALRLGGATTRPSDLLDTLRAVSGHLDELGTEEVRGASTTRYAGTIRLDDALAALPQDQRALLQDQLDELGDVSVPSLPFEVWIDADGLARRLQMRFEDAGAAGGVPGSLAISLELFDWGEDVVIDVPDRGDVTDMAGAVPGSLG